MGRPGHRGLGGRHRLHRDAESSDQGVEFGANASLRALAQPVTDPQPQAEEPTSVAG